MQFRRLLVAVAIVAGCISPAEAVPVTITKPPPTVTLIDAGQEPRKELRLKFVQGATQRVVMSMEISQKDTIDGEEIPAQTIPPIIQTPDIRVESIGLGGDATVSMQIIEAHADAEAVDVDPVVVAIMNDSLADMVGLTSTSHVTRRGIFTSTMVDLPDDVPAEIEQFLDSMMQTADQMNNPLPVEPVGIGARWRVVSVIEIGATMVVSREFELVSIDGDVLTFRTTGDFQLAHDNDDLDTPELPDGMTMTFDSLSGSVTGSATQTLHELMPRAAKASESVQIVSTMTIEGEEIKSNIHMKIGMEITTPAPIDNEQTEH